VSAPGTEVTCTGCGATVDAAEALPFACPDARPEDDVDHVLSISSPEPEDWAPDGGSDNPFVRYRRRTLAYRVARAAGMPDAVFVALVSDLDRAVALVDGGGFRVTPLSRAPAELGADLWVKVEAGNVSGSHKARHLMGAMVYLKVIQALGLPVARGLSERPLAIASCGNAALGAAVVARAADWPIDVFIPPDAAAGIVSRLRDLRARVHVCPRVDGVAGDPCYLAFRDAVAAGGLPFSVQGNDNGLVVEGGKTLAYELVDQLAGEGVSLASLFVQVGGGALGSACIQGLREALAAGDIASLPSLFTVQTHGAYPLAKAHEAFEATSGPLASRLSHAVTHREDFMRPWPTEPHSVAHGILDDETYDWAQLVRGMAESGGAAVLATEDQLREANRLANAALDVSICHTGTSGLAGLISARADGLDLPEGPVAVFLTGAVR